VRRVQSKEICSNSKSGKKNLVAEVEQVQHEYPDAEVSLWSQDEHRLGLNPVIRRVWVELGYSPIGWVNWKREWSWLYAFIEPQTGETYWWLLPRVRTDLFSAVLKDFADHFEIGNKKRVILVIDQAGWHMSEALECPEGIHLFPLPPYSPELQPAERLWPLVNEVLANQAFEGIDQVEDLVEQRCRALLNQKELIRRITSYHWWPQVIQNPISSPLINAT
jgi:transposase